MALRPLLDLWPEAERQVGHFVGAGRQRGEPAGDISRCRPEEGARLRDHLEVGGDAELTEGAEQVERHGNVRLTVAAPDRADVGTLGAGRRCR